MVNCAKLHHRQNFYPSQICFWWVPWAIPSLKPRGGSYIDGIVVRSLITLQFELLTAMILRGWDRTRVVSCFNHVISFCFCLLSPVKCYTLHIQGPVCNVIGSLEGSAWAGSQAPLPPVHRLDPQQNCQPAPTSRLCNIHTFIVNTYIVKLSVQSCLKTL